MSAPVSRPPRNRRPHHRGPRPAPGAAQSAPALATTPEIVSRGFKSSAPNSVAAKATSTVKFTTQNINPAIVQNVEFEFMTDVQAATIAPALAGDDIFARAKTGTGKTFAFLIPAIHRLLAAPIPQHDQVAILVVSPTRELAQQIAEEAKTLVRGTGLKVQCVVGGTNINRERPGLASDILIATPGRYLDHLETSGLGDKLKAVRTLVLDEADTLLDTGFRVPLERILASLPPRAQVPRQSLLFSATVSPQVQAIAKIALLPSSKFISTVDPDDHGTHTHVRQETALVPPKDALPYLVHFIRGCVAKDKETKMIVFCATANVAAFYSAVLNAAGPNSLIPVPALEIHSRLSQPKRERATKAFRDARAAVLVSSDVAARGLDFDDVTHVVQMGVPSEPEQYVHRLGRTARAGKDGAGLIVLPPFEQNMLSRPQMKKQPFIGRVDTDTILASEAFLHVQTDVHAAIRGVDETVKGRAYQAWLGYYNSMLRTLKWSKEELVQGANLWAREALLIEGPPPPLPAQTVGKMQLKGTPGLNVVKGLPKARGGGGRGRGQTQQSAVAADEVPLSRMTPRVNGARGAPRPNSERATPSVRERVPRM